jgi:tRNA threonylcarbamoyladenosine biosynthesis protein TsaE
MYFSASMNADLPGLTYTLDTIDDAVKRFWQQTQDYYIFAFSGEMGAGKTTFIHKLCDLLHVQDTVSSPTFALINEYHYTDAGKDQVIFHLDWYRLRDSAEAINAGMEDCIDHARRKEARCFIEWPEKAIELLPDGYVAINIETIDPVTRKMTITLVEKNH